MLPNYDIVDVAKRLFAGYPRSWSPEPTWDDPPDIAIEDQVSPNLKSILLALAAGWKSGDASVTGYYDLLQYVQAQTRINTATGFWLDYIGRDFSGGSIARYRHEKDDAYRRRLQIEILRPKGTRCALECGLTNLTGYAPTIIEPMNPGDTGSYAGLVSNVRLTVAHSAGNSPHVYVNDTTGLTAGMVIGGNGIRNTVVITSINGNELTISPFISAQQGDTLYAYDPVGPIGYSVAGAYGSLNSNTETTVTLATTGTKIVVNSSADIVPGMLLSGAGILTPVTITAVNGNTLTVSASVTLAIGNIISAYYPAAIGTPFQLFVTATRPNGEGIPNVNGYSMSHAGYSTVGSYGYYGGNSFPPNYGYGQYCSLDEIQGDVTDESIYQNVADSMPAGTIAWTKIVSQLPSTGLFGTGLLGVNFYLNYTTLAIPPEQLPNSLAVILPVNFSMSALFNVAYVRGIAGILQPKLKTTLTQIGNFSSAMRVPFTMKATVIMPASMAIKIPALFSMNAVVLQSNSSVTYLGASSVPPFIIGQSLLTAPGGELGHTFILGSGNSKLGASIYGY